MDLSRQARWVLVNQYRLLRNLDPDAAHECERAITVLERGYEFEYDDLVPGLNEEPMSNDACREVIDILAMFCDLRRSYEALVDRTAVDESAITFRGFDGNHEARALGYARFLTRDGRWEELADCGDGLNSHWPMMETYRHMLAPWRRCRDEREPAVTLGRRVLSAEDIAEICGPLMPGGAR